MNIKSNDISTQNKSTQDKNTQDKNSKNLTTESSQLVDGQTPGGPADVLALLEKLGIESSTITHEPMRTVADSKEFRYGVPGGYSKNFFLRNKKGKMWLVALHEDRVIDLKQLGEKLGAGRISFASEDRLMKYLGVIPGAVTPLAVINDHGGNVTAVLDSHLLTLAPLHFHPCDNSKTTSVDRDGLLQYMQACNHNPDIVDFED